MIKAKYISIWDDGVVISSSCLYNPLTNDVTEIEEVDVEGLDLEILDKEYIELPDGTEITCFTTDGETL